MALFGRKVIVDVGPEGGTGRRLEGLDVEFRAHHTRSGSPNELQLRIFNPSPQTVAAATRRDAVVRLRVGYDGDVPRQIFLGSPNVKGGVLFEPTRPDHVLTILAADGGRAFGLARLNVSFRTETTAQQVFEAIADALGLARGKTDLGDALPFPRGIALVGPARPRLDEFVASIDREWLVRDQALHVIRRGGDTGEQAVVFSAEDGNLIGSPKTTDEGIEVTALIAPSIRPGKVFKVESRDVNGLFVADDVVFEGSGGHSSPFYVNVKGRAR